MPVSVLPWFVGFAGAIYGATAIVCGAIFVALALQLGRSSEADRRPAHRLFMFSIFYLFVLFAALLAGNSNNRWSSTHLARAASTATGPVQAEFSAHPVRIAPVPPISKQTSSDMRCVVLALALICAAMVGGCSEGVLDPKGPIASAERLIMLNSLGIMLAIVIPTILATLGTAFWFRASNTRARYMPDFAYSGRLELLVWSIPIMTVILVGGVTWIGSYDLDPPKPIASAEKPVRVQVVALDWKWLFIYPDHGIAAVNQLTIPVDTPIRFELTSSGVMNSFFVPQLGGQIYTMAGMVTRLYLRPTMPGPIEEYRQITAAPDFPTCTSKSMRFRPRNLRSGWLQRAPMAPVLDAQSYAALAKPSQAVTPFTYRAVAPDLFDGIMSNVAMQSGDPVVPRLRRVTKGRK